MTVGLLAWASARAQGSFGKDSRPLFQIVTVAVSSGFKNAGSSAVFRDRAGVPIGSPHWIRKRHS